MDLETTMKHFNAKLTSSLLYLFAPLSNGYETDELNHKATISSSLPSANAASSVTKEEKREMADEFFKQLLFKEESKMIDVWKMAIDKKPENPNRNLVEYINDEGELDFQPVFAGKITLVQTKLVSLLRSEQEIEGIYTDTELSVDELIQQMLRRTIPIIESLFIHTYLTKSLH